MGHTCLQLFLDHILLIGPTSYPRPLAAKFFSMGTTIVNILKWIMAYFLKVLPQYTYPSGTAKLEKNRIWTKYNFAVGKLQQYKQSSNASLVNLLVLI